MNASNSRTVRSSDNQDRRTVSGCDSDVQIVNVTESPRSARKPASTELLVSARKHIEQYLASVNVDPDVASRQPQPSPTVSGLNMDQDEALRILSNRFGFRTIHIGYGVQYMCGVDSTDMSITWKAWTVTIHGEDLGAKHHCVQFTSSTLSTAVDMACKSSIPATSIP